jgi:hypothetical protein
MVRDDLCPLVEGAIGGEHQAVPYMLHDRTSIPLRRIDASCRKWRFRYTMLAAANLCSFWRGLDFLVGVRWGLSADYAALAILACARRLECS